MVDGAGWSSRFGLGLGGYARRGPDCDALVRCQRRTSSCTHTLALPTLPKCHGGAQIQSPARIARPDWGCGCNGGRLRAADTRASRTLSQGPAASSPRATRAVQSRVETRVAEQSLHSIIPHCLRRQHCCRSSRVPSVSEASPHTPEPWPTPRPRSKRPGSAREAPSSPGSAARTGGDRGAGTGRGCGAEEDADKMIRAADIGCSCNNPSAQFRRSVDV